MKSQETPSGLTYRDAGVDIDAQDRAIELMRQEVRATFTPQVVTDIGAFGGMYAFDPSEYSQPLLVSSIDGVGTKLKIAFLMDRHDTVGEDLVAHCVNDILVLGAKPLFFLDYVATGRLSPEVVAAVVRGLARGCRAAGCALIAGETAEMPGFYQPGEYDVAGCIVGVVDRSQVIDGHTIRPGDVLLGLASAGLHTNGYSLARKILLDQEGLTVQDYVAELGTTVGEELLKPHLCYRAPIERVRALVPVKGLAHITGGGLVDNLPRILPEGTAAVIQKGTWPVLPIFKLLADRGRVPEADLYRTFNMGVGMVLVTTAQAAEAAQECLNAAGTPTYRIGTVVEGKRQVEIR